MRTRTEQMALGAVLLATLGAAAHRLSWALAADASAASTTGLQEVVVTAERRT